MAKITGIGGVFLNLKVDLNKLLNWYKEKLSLDITEYGVNFLEPSVFTLITFESSGDKAILNFTVDNLEEFIAELKQKDVEVIQEIKEYEYGKFAQIRDLYGYIIEFWEPYKEEYIEMVNKEIEDYK